MYACSTCASLAEYDSKCVYYGSLNSAINPNEKETTRENNYPTSLPINLSKYRLLFKRTANGEMASASSSNLNEIPLILIDVNNSVNNEHSDNSSFCEEIEASPKRSPQYIVISSPSDSGSERDSIQSNTINKNEPGCSHHLTSKKKSKKKKEKKKKKKKKRSHSSSSRSSTMSMNQSYDKKHKKNKKKKKSKKSKIKTNSD
jgi:hypothetical protein